MSLYPDYVTSGSFKSYVRIDDTDDAAELALAITAASRAVDQATHRQFGQSDEAEARLYTPTWDRNRRRTVIRVDDLMTLSGLQIMVDTDGDGTYGTEVEPGEFQNLPLNAAGDGKPWTLLVHSGNTSLPSREGSVEITATWGWEDVPVTIQQATLVQANRFFKRRDAPFGVAGSPELGNELRLLAKVDPDVALMVQPYKRRWGAG